MRTLIMIFIDLLCILAKLLSQGGTKALMAESLLLRHQLKTDGLYNLIVSKYSC